MMKDRITLWTDDGEIDLPSKWAICSTCRGNGHHNPHAYTADEFAEAFPFEEDVEDYLAGRYDQHCNDCDGQGKLKVVDWSRLTPDQTQAYKEQLEDDREYEAMVEAERRFGC